MLDLLADDVSEDAAPLHARQFNLRSFAALGESVEGAIAANWRTMTPPEGSTRARVRLFGPAVEGHRSTVRLTTQALSLFQDLVSAVAMAAVGKRSLFGAVPGDVRAQTELFLFPRPAFGSVVFELLGPTAPDVSDELPGISSGENSADRAATQLVEVLGHSADDADREVLTAELKHLGPRVATYLRRLANLPIREGLFLDLDWEQGNGDRVSATLEAEQAIRLVEVIESSRATVQERQMDGVLVTISTEEPLGLRLHDGRRIPMAPHEDLDVDALTAFFNEPVTATLEVEVTSHPVTGRDTTRYTLLAIEGALRVDTDELAT